MVPIPAGFAAFILLAASLPISLGAEAELPPAPPDGPVEALRLASTVLEARAAWAQQKLALEAAHAASLLRGRWGDAFERAVAGARVGAEWQARTLLLELGKVISLAGGAPSEAALALATAHDVVPGRELRDAFQRLDALAEPARGALARFLRAALAFHEAAHGASEPLRDVDVAAHLAALDREGPVVRAGAPGGAAGEPWDATTLLVVESTRPAALGGPWGEGAAAVLAAREALLDAAVALRAALPPAAEATECDPVQALPALSIDLAACDNTYHDDVAVLLDAGGDDAYRNNAGGNNLAAGSCEVGALRGAAVLFDMGSGRDTYGDPANPRGCGANGGAFLGAGALLDDGGADTYVAGGRGGNGGGFYAGWGMLVDAAGDDAYRGGEDGSNGGANKGWALLVDAQGRDDYVATYRGANGGAAGFGAGPTALIGVPPAAAALLDLEGDDTYTADCIAGNGGAVWAGAAMLLDLGGNDAYAPLVPSVVPVCNGGFEPESAVPGTYGFNGGAEGHLARGFLFDAAGDDAYTGGGWGVNGGANYHGAGALVDGGGADVYAAWCCGANGGGINTGVGALVDFGGDDLYHFPVEQEGFEGHGGVNGGGFLGGRGFLLDAAGTDRYLARSFGTNGGAWGQLLTWSEPVSVGHLVDLDGDDVYIAEDDGVNGGGAVFGVGLLRDRAGNDRYVAGSRGTNGGGFAGRGLLVDEAGADTYVAGARGANGGAGLGTLAVPLGGFAPGGLCATVAGACAESSGQAGVTVPAVGLLLDLEGSDVYDDEEGGSGADRTVAPKGMLGAQMDAPHGPS